MFTNCMKCSKINKVLMFIKEMKYMKKIYFLEGLPGVGKSTITNYIANLNKKNIHTVNEIIVDIEDKTPIEQDLFIMNDNLKINKYDEGIIIIDRGPISTLTYNIVRDELVENFSSKQVIDWFNTIKDIFKQDNVFIYYLTTNGKEYYLPYNNEMDPNGSIKNQKRVEEVALYNIKKYSKNYKIIEYNKKNMEDIINEIIN